MQKSFVFGELPPAPSRDIIEELRACEVAWISDSMDMNLMDSAIRAIYPGVARIVGPAVTVTVPPGDVVMAAAALKETRPGDVLVIDSRGDTSRAVWGEFFSMWAHSMDVAGVVIDGATRDVGAIKALGLPVFTRGTTPCRPLLGGYGEINVPVSCGGVCVVPGDIVVADGEGVIVIPLRHLEEVMERLRVTAQRERTHNGVTPSGRAAFEAYFQRSFAPRMAGGRLGATPRPGAGE